MFTAFRHEPFRPGRSSEGPDRHHVQGRHPLSAGRSIQYRTADSLSYPIYLSSGSNALPVNPQCDDYNMSNHVRR